MVSFTSEISRSGENAANGYSLRDMEKRYIPLVTGHRRRAIRSAFSPHPDLTPSPGLRRPEIARSLPTQSDYRGCRRRSRARSGSSQGSTRVARHRSELPTQIGRASCRERVKLAVVGVIWL